jgi:hypothetical protein
MKKRDLHNPSCRSTHSFNPVPEKKKHSFSSLEEHQASCEWISKTHRICMLHLGVPALFVLLSQTDARCLLHSSETSVYHEIFLVFFFKGVLDMICQTVKTLKP